jgi:hypothetical protein
MQHAIYFYHPKALLSLTDFSQPEASEGSSTDLRTVRILGVTSRWDAAIILSEFFD